MAPSSPTEVARPALTPSERHLAPDARLQSADLTRSGSLPRAWVAGWSASPDAPLLREPDGRAVTTGRMEEATRIAAGRLVAAGLRPGDRVLWSTGPTIDAVVAHVGALRAGLVVVPVNTASTAAELAHLVRDVRPAGAIAADPARAARALAASPGAPVIADPSLGSLPAPVGDCVLDAASPGDPALICYTSGTTGVPKGAVLTHRNLLAATRSVTMAWRWTPDDRLVHALPVFHAHGLCVGLYGTLLAGASAVLLPAFDPAEVADAAERHRATLFFGVPTMYHRLAGSGHLGRLAGLRLCVSGSAPLAVDLHRRASAQLGTTVLERYGLSETLMDVSNPWEGERRPGTVGFPLPGVEVGLAADGEILVRGPNVFGGYWERPVATAEAFLAADDGGPDWFRTGDLGAVEDGYLAIRGRSKELVISGGFNVYPAEVEEVLATHPAVAEVAVTGTPSDEWGEVVTAWVVADGPPPSAADLAEFTADRLAPYKRPRIVHVVDRLPRNALGKVLRGALGR